MRICSLTTFYSLGYEILQSYFNFNFFFKVLNKHNSDICFIYTIVNIYYYIFIEAQCQPHRGFYNNNVITAKAYGPAAQPICLIKVFEMGCDRNFQLFS